MIEVVPGLAPVPEPVYQLASGLTITLDQVIVFACLAVVLVVGGFVLRFTTAGVIVRAVVDSESMARLSGLSPQLVSSAVWAISFMLSGLAGVLIAPSIGLTESFFTLLTGTAFASVVVAKLRHPGRAVLAALAIGVVTSLITEFAPTTGTLAAELVPAAEGGRPPTHRGRAGPGAARQLRAAAACALRRPERLRRRARHPQRRPQRKASSCLATCPGFSRWSVWRV